MTVKEKMQNAEWFGQKMRNLYHGDPILCAELCGRLAQMQRDNEVIKALKAEIETLRAENTKLAG